MLYCNKNDSQRTEQNQTRKPPEALLRPVHRTLSLWLPQLATWGQRPRSRRPGGNNLFLITCYFSPIWLPFSGLSKHALCPAAVAKDRTQRKGSMPFLHPKPITTEQPRSRRGLRCLEQEAVRSQLFTVSLPTPHTSKIHHSVYGNSPALSPPQRSVCPSSLSVPHAVPDKDVSSLNAFPASQGRCLFMEPGPLVSSLLCVTKSPHSFLQRFQHMPTAGSHHLPGWSMATI